MFILSGMGLVGLNILLAEDDERLGKHMQYMLKQENNQVDWVKNGQDACEYAMLSSYDVIILDWMMPKKSGIDVCTYLRKHGYQGGIVMLTAKDALDDIVHGLDIGADDYMIKPFEFKELLARVGALSRRKVKKFEQVLTAGELSLDLDAMVVKNRQQKIELTRKEYQLCEFLMRNKGIVLTREQLIEYIWGYDAAVSDNALDALVKLLRKKIDVPNESSVIENIRGVGYKMSDHNVSFHS